jgi:hypothetical protein
MGTRSQELFGAGMWTENSVRARRPGSFSLQERHTDGRRWLELRRYPTKAEARAAMDALIAEGAGRDRYRVQPVRG